MIDNNWLADPVDWPSRHRQVREDYLDEVNGLHLGRNFGDVVMGSGGVVDPLRLVSAGSGIAS